MDIQNSPMRTAWRGLRLNTPEHENVRARNDSKMRLFRPQVQNKAQAAELLIAAGAPGS
jgi:hypothetical protein